MTKQVLTLEQFLQPANREPMSTMIDAHLDSIQGATGATDRQMLRTFAFVLRAIATSMPWDDEQGLDAQRFEHRLKAFAPSWRECIGAVLGLSFTKKEQPQTQTATPTVNSEHPATSVGGDGGGAG